MVAVVAGVGLVPTPAAASEPVRYLDPVVGVDEVVETTAVPYAGAIDADGQEQTLLLDLFEIAGDTTPSRPVLLLLPGGGFTGDNRDSSLLVRWARAMARRGYVVATIDYRTDDDENPLALFASVERAVEDLRAAVRWFRANQATGGHADEFPLAAPSETVDLRIDPERISAGGYSAGAVTATSAAVREVLHGADRDPDSPTFEPIVNATNDEWPWGISAAVSAAGAGLGGSDAGDPPLLMFHGDADTRVAYDADTGEDYDIGFSGVATCLRARSARQDCLFRTFPGVAHGLFDAGAREATMQDDTARFLSCRVGAATGFTDLTDWVELAVGWASRAEVVSGFADATFRPAAPLTRGQLVAMLWALLDRPPGPGGAAPFSDTPAWLAEPLAWAADAGIATGFSDGTFRAGDTVTRAQAARLLHRAAGEVDVVDLPSLELVDVPPWVTDAVRWLVAPRAVQLLGGEGIATGYGDATFRPGLPVTRGQVVRWLHGLALAGPAWGPDLRTTPVGAACFRDGDPPEAPG